MEKSGYREMLELLTTTFPGKITITPKEAAAIMDANIKTVYSAINRVKDPLPAKSLAGKIIIPITAFAQWLC